MLTRNTMGSFGVFLLAALLCLLQGCAVERKPVPIGVVPPARALSSADEQYGHQVLSQLSEKFPLEYNHPRYDNIIAVVHRLTKAAKADKDPWHVYLLRDDTFKNAAATRGNHIFIWTAMLDATKDDEELATVLAHEVAHLLCGHTDPDPSEEVRKLLIGIGSIAASIAVSQAVSDPYLGRNLGNLAGSAAQEISGGLLMNPHSKSQELEADQVGLFILAAAGYNPEAAVNFWRHAEKDPDYSNGIAFFSTHPPAHERIKRLESALPLAMQWYREGAPENLALPTQAGASTDSPRDLLPVGDSFNIDAKPDRPRPATNRQSVESRWVVAKKKALLYSKASRTSWPIGEFREGAVITAQGQSANWIRIVHPDHGYLQKKDLSPHP